MSIDDLIQVMATRDDATGDVAALRDFTAALHQVDADPAEGRRIRELAELVDSEIAAYDQGLAALDQGDAQTAETLLLRAGPTGIADADGILAELLTQRPDESAPLGLRQRAAETRAHRAILSAAYSRPTLPAPASGLLSLLRRIPTIARRHRSRVGADDLAEVLLAAMEVKDPYTRAHLERISQLVALIGQHAGMRPARIEAARLAGLFHDIGKLAIPNTILHKSGTLTEEEYTSIQQHTVRGVTIVQQMPEFFDDTPATTRNVLVHDTLAGILHHHEKYNGRGYPLGLAGNDIPEIARAVAVADVFDAMTGVRSYRGARSIDEAVTELRRYAGADFDPHMVEAFLDALTTHRDLIEDLVRTNRPDATDHRPGRPEPRSQRIIERR